MSSFATLADVQAITGKTFTQTEGERITTLLGLVSNALLWEAEKVGKDLESMMIDSASYASVVKLVTVDVTMRAYRQNLDGEPVSQESQSALGYTWSGTYAVPGGGVAGAIMRNDLKRLGLRRQRYGVMEIWDGSME